MSLHLLNLTSILRLFHPPKFGPMLIIFLYSAQSYGVCGTPYNHSGLQINNGTIQGWSTGPIDISCATSVDITMSAAGTGPMEHSDYLNVYYKLNGGEIVNIFQATNSFNTTTVQAIDLTGYTVEIIVEGSNTWSDEFYLISNITVSGSPTQAANWDNLDIGPVSLSGSVSWAGNGDITITAAGKDIGHHIDRFHFLHTALAGDGSVTAYIKEVDGPSNWTKVGLMIRETLDSDAANSTFLLRPEFGSLAQHRPTKAYGTTNSTWEEQPVRNDGLFRSKRHINYVDLDATNYRARYLQPGKWLKIVRKDSKILSYSSDDGLCWNLRASDDINWNQQTFAGVALSSHIEDQLATATIKGLRVDHTPPSNVNENCQRSKIDGQIAAPEMSDWIIKPGVFGGDTWSMTFTDPNPIQRPHTCMSNIHPDLRRYSDDDTFCPTEVTQAPWTLEDYTFNTGSWMHLQESGFGNRGLGKAEHTRTPFNQKQFWLRREFQLSTADFDKTVLWGRWANSVSIYFNGVLATNVHDSWMSEAYHYLGIRDEARAALVDGTNVIAAKVSCQNCQNAFTDFGLARHEKLGQYPVENEFESNDPNSMTAKLAKVFTDYTKELALLGGTFAVREDGELVESVSLGWRDATLKHAMPKDPIVRLASVDKGLTRAAIRHLIDDVNNEYEYELSRDTIVFGPSGVLSHIQPLGGSFGAGVTSITVGHLLDHKSGLSGIGNDDQGWHDEAAYQYSIPSSAMTAGKLMGIWVSEPTLFTPGTQELYSSHGHAVLRHIVEEVSEKSLDDFFDQDMNATDIVVARERIEDRKLDPNNENHRETGYQLIGKETRSRWYELDEYLALSASTKGLTKFFSDNSLLDSNGGGAMDGSHGAAFNQGNRSFAWVWNSDKPPSERFEFKRKIAQYDDRHPGSCDPRGLPNQMFRIDSDYHKEWFLHGDSDGNDLQFTTLGEEDEVLSWTSVNWSFEPQVVNGVTYYRIRNAESDLLLNVSGGTVSLSTLSNSAPEGHWILHDETKYFRLESRAYPGHFLNVEDRNEPRINQYHGGYLSVRWYICN